MFCFGRGMLHDVTSSTACLGHSYGERCARDSKPRGTGCSLLVRRSCSINLGHPVKRVTGIWEFSEKQGHPYSMLAGETRFQCTGSSLVRLPVDLTRGQKQRSKGKQPNVLYKKVKKTSL
jgi:hypothetical protein